MKVLPWSHTNDVFLWKYGVFFQFALTHNCSQSLFIHRRQENRKELKYAELGHRCFPSEGDTQLGLMYVSDHLASGKHLLRHWTVDQPFFPCPDKLLLCKETLLMTWGGHDFREHLLAWLKYQHNRRKRGSKTLGRLGCFSERLHVLKLNSVQCYKQVLRKPSWKCLKISVSLAAILQAEQLQWETQIPLKDFSMWCVVISARVCTFQCKEVFHDPAPCEGLSRKGQAR